ncbi:MAG: hypothetical protein NT078_00540 [Candidatus Azambacteria bacterium]|nr:hypothetical protein [Candidatus Azambacteria bacterium]
MVKYKEIYQQMLAENQDLFSAFKKVHDQYAEDEEKWRKQFNEEGIRIMAVIKKYENRLCSRSENSGYGKFSSTLTDKFWGEVKTYLPLIDFVGTE